LWPNRKAKRITGLKVAGWQKWVSIYDGGGDVPLYHCSMNQNRKLQTAMGNILDDRPFAV